MWERKDGNPFLLWNTETGEVVEGVVAMMLSPQFRSTITRVDGCNIAWAGDRPIGPTARKRVCSKEEFESTDWESVKFE